MSLLKDTIKTLTLAIEKGTNLPVVNNDITENEPRPCFYIEPTSIISDIDGIQCEHEEQTFQITYFGLNTYAGYLDLLTMKDTLQECLLGINIHRNDGSTMYITSIEWDIYRGDMVLTAKVIIELFGRNLQAENEETHSDFMEILNYNENEI